MNSGKPTSCFPEQADDKFRNPAPARSAKYARAIARDRRRTQARRLPNKGLSENGHVVDVARDGIQGRLLAREGE